MTLSIYRSANWVKCSMYNRRLWTHQRAQRHRWSIITTKPRDTHHFWPMDEGAIWFRVQGMRQRTEGQYENKEAASERTQNANSNTIITIETVWHFQIGRRSVFFIFLRDLSLKMTEFIQHDHKSLGFIQKETPYRWIHFLKQLLLEQTVKRPAMKKCILLLLFLLS